MKTNISTTNSSLKSSTIVKARSEKQIYNLYCDKWIHIPRANDSTKCIALEAIAYMAALEYLFCKNPDEIIFNSNLLKHKSHHQKKQRGRFLKQIAHIYNIKYYAVYEYKGKKYYQVFSATRTQNSEAILKNPKLFFKKKELARVIKLEENDRFNDSVKGLNLTPFTYRNKKECNSFNIDLEVNSKENIEFTNLKLDQNKVLEFKPKNFSYQKKNLIKFSPLSENDVITLQNMSGRQFNANFMDQLLMKLAREHPSYGFYTKQLFFKYFSQVLHNEMRPEEKTNKDQFIIMNLHECKINRFLQKVEATSIKFPTADNILKTKIVSTLDSKDAYELLEGGYIKIDQMKGQVFIATHAPVPISDQQYKLIMSAIRAIGFDYKLTIKASYHTKGTTDNKMQSAAVEYILPEVKLPENAWGEIRKQLIATYGEEGKALDVHWFSKLEAKINEDSKTIDLSSQSNLLIERIQDRYLRIIEDISKAIGFRCQLKESVY